MFYNSVSVSERTQQIIVVVCFQSGHIGVDEEVDEMAGKTSEEVQEYIEEKEAKANAQILEMVNTVERTLYIVRLDCQSEIISVLLTPLQLEWL